MKKRSLIQYLAFLHAVLFPAIDDPTNDGDPAPAADPAADPNASAADPDTGTDPELDIESEPAASPPPPPPPPPPSADPVIQAALEQLLRTQNQPRPSDEDRALADPNTPADERFRLETNRAVRTIWEQNQQTQRIAADAADQAKFQNLCLSDPIARKYATKVEAALAQMKAKGVPNVPPREALLTFVLGNEVRARAAKGGGKGKSGAAGTPAPAGTPGTPRAGAAPRGTPTNARSDANVKGGKTESDKRRERLANQII